VEAMGTRLAVVISDNLKALMHDAIFTAACNVMTTKALRDKVQNSIRIE